jgi:hypothetical protein
MSDLIPSTQTQQLAYQALGLQPVDSSLSPAERCALRERIIETCLEMPQWAWLRVGTELYTLKYSEDKEFIHSTIWSPEDKARGWEQYIKKRFQNDRDPEKSIAPKTATAWMQWAVLHPCMVKTNQDRAERGLLPLPLPSSISQLRPYQSMMRRVDDWVEPEAAVPGAPAVSFEMEPPYAEDQSEVIAAWQEAWEAIPPDKRVCKGEARPPTERESRDYLRRKEGLKQLKQREEREIGQAKREALTIGQKPAAPAPATPPPSAAPPKATKKPAPPKKSAEELEAERRQFQIQQDVRDYRLKLNNLQQSAESLDAFLRNTLAREGTEAYLQAMRQADRGIFSVSDDIQKLRDAVVVCQSVYKLITEPYCPPQPISRREVDPSTASVDVEAVA